MNELLSKLGPNLNRKKFLLVLDDVWNGNRSKWMELQDLLVDGSKGSKILVTTRALSVAKATNASRCHQLHGLPEAESLSLLMQMASKQGHEWRNQALEAIGKEIVHKCAGVPLAIMTVGRLLSTSRNREEDWLTFKNLDLSRIIQEEGDIIPTLRLSYDSLPLNLKQCFAYCSLFPKGQVLDPLELSRMWAVQGFISPSSMNAPEEAGLEFMEFVWRSFFQDVEEDIYGNIIGCKMHDLMHDLAKLVAGENCILLDHTTDQTIPGRVRHASGYLEDFQLKTDEEDNRLRTCLILSNRGPVDCHHLEKCIVGFQKLRALRLREAPNVCVLPKSIGKLRHLRHLDLSYSTDLKVLPLSISKLCNLETLNLEGCTRLEELPSSITKLVNLRQLDIRGCAELTKIPKGIGKLTCLQMLSQFVVGKKGDLNAATLDEMKGLKKLKGNLGIRHLQNFHGTESSFSVKELNLQSLELVWVREPNDNDKAAAVAAKTREEMVFERFRPHRDLKGLRVEGYRGAMFPAWVSELSNLVKLEIVSCCYCKRMPYLDHLPFLKRLCLAGLSQLECIEISEESEQHWMMSRCFFPSMEVLELMNLPKFKGWERTRRRKRGPSYIDMEENSQMVPTFCSKVLVQISGCPRFSHVQVQGRGTSLVGMTENVLKQLVRMGLASKPASMTSLYSASFLDLESITIDNMVDVEHLKFPKELFQSLSSLQSLVIKDCRVLTTLCGTVLLRYLTNLQDLRISSCPELDLSVEDDGNAEDCDEDMSDVQLQGHNKLRVLHIDALPKMEHFPEWFQHLSHLEHLSISDCDGLKALPHWIGNLTMLTTLNIWSCEGLRILPRRLILHFLTTLESLSIEWCPELNLFGESDDKGEEYGNTSRSQFSGPTRLRELAITGSKNMVSLPWWVQHLTNLESLDVSFCENLTALPNWFPQLVSLKRLDVSLCGQLSKRCQMETGEDWPKILHIERVFA